MAIDTFLLKAVGKLLMLSQTEYIVRVIMQDRIVVAVPAGVAGKVGGRIAGYGITTRTGVSAMSGCKPLGKVDSGLGAVERHITVNICCCGAMAVEADY